mgnify:CR=1 FL=1
MIVIKTRQPDPELEQKIRMLLEREHIEAEQISIDSWEKLVLPGLTLDGMTHEVSCNGRKVSLTRFAADACLPRRTNLLKRRAFPCCVGTKL